MQKKWTCARSTHRNRSRRLKACPRRFDSAMEACIFPLPAPDLSSAVSGLHHIVNAYKDRASLDRTSQTLIEGLDDIHPDLTALVIFPRFEVTTVLTLAGRGDVLPTGITRFTVSPRALHLNYPLHELSSGKPIAYKEAYLQHWVQERIKHKGVRHYAEATFLFDE